ncbi:hypothetical protein [uncultured Draconibacterium sp.]|uniref:hypothetical protein n=1 Tax=uncultured Draconibacterium sp. TaxID=1573823 RepID=UPI0029C8B490|nr:hypothetical protein [uncultured Draconibacterium sp.]
MKTLFKITIIAIMAFSLTRCGMLNTASLVGHTVNGDIESKSFSYDYETNLTSKSELISAFAAVGAQLGYTVESQTPEMISWETGESNKLQEYFGKYSFSGLSASITWDDDENKQTLRISSYVGGNFSEADKAKVDTLIQGFETKLRENLEEGHYYLKKIE